MTTVNRPFRQVFRLDRPHFSWVIFTDAPPRRIDRGPRTYWTLTWSANAVHVIKSPDIKWFVNDHDRPYLYPTIHSIISTEMFPTPEAAFNHWQAMVNNPLVALLEVRL